MIVNRKEHKAVIGSSKVCPCDRRCFGWGPIHRYPRKGTLGAMLPDYPRLRFLWTEVVHSHALGALESSRQGLLTDHLLSVQRLQLNGLLGQYHQTTISKRSEQRSMLFSFCTRVNKVISADQDERGTRELYTLKGYRIAAAYGYVAPHVALLFWLACWGSGWSHPTARDLTPPSIMRGRKANCCSSSPSKLRTSSNVTGICLGSRFGRSTCVWFMLLKRELYC